MLVENLSSLHLLPKNHGVLNSGENGTASYQVALPEEVFSNLYQACGDIEACGETTTVELEFQNPDIVDVSVLSYSLC